MELITLVLFCAMLLMSIILHIELVYALAAGLVIFLAYAALKGNGPKALASMCVNGIRTVTGILTTFVFIGVLTALWRAAGTIPAIVCWSASLIRPAVFLLMTFLLNCLVSFLTGTAFGTGATMGVICATIGHVIGFPILLTGGAVLSGVFFGDRCSPVSTSMLLVSSLTETESFDNIRRMMRTALLPFLMTCVIYGAVGLSVKTGGDLPDLFSMFGTEFRLHPVCLVPAAVILALSLLRVPVRKTMAASILTAVPVCLFLQGMSVTELLRTAVSGYRAVDPALSSMINGGGILSMVRVSLIVCISSAFSGIFEATGLLNGAKTLVLSLSRKTTDFAAVLAASCILSMISCNQSLATILSFQLCRGTVPDRKRLAIHLEDTVILVAGLVPWSIAGGVPLASVGAPTSSMLFACYLYLVPLWRLAGSFIEKKRNKEGRRREEL